MTKLHAALRAPLDDKLYSLDAEEIAFYKEKTGIHDDGKLKEHVVRVQHDAYEVYPYMCIRWFTFARLKIARHPAYSHLLNLGKERKDALFIDIGCCFGNDIRKAIADGFPSKNCLGTDIQGAFWKLGYRLFTDTLETFDVPFIEGDVLDPAFLALSPPTHTPPQGPAPDLASLMTLTPLTGRLSAIHASMFFHLFTEEHQLQVARALAGLLAPTRGAMIFGYHTGETEKGMVKAKLANGDPVPMFCHSAESWREMWEEEIFEKGAVEVRAELQPLKAPPGIPIHVQSWQLVWSMTRL